jgi:hypothetical protein
MLTALVLTGASILAACSDLAARRIPNALTFGLAVLAVGLSALHGLWSAAVSVLLFLVVFLAGSIPYGRGARKLARGRHLSHRHRHRRRYPLHRRTSSPRPAAADGESPRSCHSGG